MELSEGQETAIVNAVHWFEKFHNSDYGTVKPFFFIAGYAGTGKTTIVKLLQEAIRGTVLYVAYTGKAALVMRKNGCKGASTIHSLIYMTEELPDGSLMFHLNPNSPASSASLIVVDECSMVDESLAKDLMSYRVPIIVLGDPAQLPPVAGTGYFINSTPDVLLTEIHRQARDNPIIDLATQVRMGNRLKTGEYGTSKVISIDEFNDDMLTASDQILAGKNDTRNALNLKVRTMLGYKNPMPEINEKLVCLKNDKKIGIFNGGTFRVHNPVLFSKKKKSHLSCNMILRSEDFDKLVRVEVRKEFFTGDVDKLNQWDLKASHHFDFGHVLTVHKSQGSQWDNVLLLNESRVFRQDWSKWLYTGITRACDSVTIVADV